MRPSALVLCVACVGCGHTTPEVDGEVILGLDVDQALTTVDGRFLSVAVDSSQLVGLEFWHPDATSDTEWVPVEPYDFGREQLRALAADRSSLAAHRGHPGRRDLERPE